jgi:CRP-like cAMP-binding protein
MNDDDKKWDLDGPALKLENESLNEAVPEVEIDPSEVVLLDCRPETDGGSSEQDGAAVENRPEIPKAVDKPAQAVGFATRKFAAGDLIFQEGDPGEEAYLILNGKVKISRRHQDRRMVINQLGEGQIFGEMAIITGEPRAASAEALEPTDLFVITENKLNENLSHNLAIVKSLIDQLIERLKQLLKQQSAMVGKVERALAREKRVEKLKALAGEYAKANAAGKIDQPLAALLKMIREL